MAQSRTPYNHNPPDYNFLEDVSKTGRSTYLVHPGSVTGTVGDGGAGRFGRRGRRECFAPSEGPLAQRRAEHLDDPGSGLAVHRRLQPRRAGAVPLRRALRVLGALRRCGGPVARRLRPPRRAASRGGGRRRTGRRADRHATHHVPSRSRTGVTLRWNGSGTSGSSAGH